MVFDFISANAGIMRRLWCAAVVAKVGVII